jgi:hypothetical protein
MAKYGVMSYNMSFASDQYEALGAAIGSEKHFIAQGGKWDNALGMVETFFKTPELHPAVVGLQEINHTDFIKKKVKLIKEYNSGTYLLARKLVGNGKIREFPLTAGKGGEFGLRSSENKYQTCGYLEGDKYAIAFWGPGYDKPFAQRPVVALIWDTGMLGKKISDYGADLGTDDIFIGAKKKQAGRPIYIVKTSKGFLLVVLHGPNFADESLKGMPVLKESLEFHIDAARDKLDAKLNKVIIMGDFNDPHFGINDSKPIGDFRMGRTKDNKTDVLSCCYNFNSSCPTGLYNATDKTVEGTVDEVLKSVTAEDKKELIKDTYKRVGTVKIKALPFECFIDVSPQVQSLNSNGKPKTKDDKGKQVPVMEYTKNNEELGNPLAREMTPDGRGDLGNYKFTGDYVMSSMKVDVPLTLLRKTLGLYHADKPSKESDHEPVYAVFSGPASGGRRTRKQKNRKRQTRRR